MIRAHVFGPLRLSLLAAIGAASTISCGSTVEDDGGTGASGTGGSGAGGTGGSGAGMTLAECEGAEAILQPDGSDSGFALCSNGTKVRVAAVACDTEQNLTACVGDEDSTSCLTDADCTDAPNGVCFSGDSSSVGGVGTYCSCSYACGSDADCSDGQVCVCSGVSGKSHCAPAACETGDDCASGQCGLSEYDDGCGTNTSLHCRSPLDECGSDADCVGSESGEQCAVDYDSDIFTCLTANCAIGRPLMVDGSARATQATERADWRDIDVAPRTAGLAPEIVEALASRWQDVAAMEHASVASFARFTLQLMAVGAPADLLAATQEAASEEIEHARVAYAIASTYASRPLGPAALDLQDMRIETDRAQVIRGLIEEACVGEAIGVAECLAFADTVRDPVIATVLTRVAEDEQRHAALAWRALTWMLDGADDDTLAMARATFERATETMRKDPVVEGPVAQEHGLWSGAQLGAVRRKAIDEVVLPCAKALLG